MLIPCSVSGSQADKAPRPLRLLLSGDPMGAPSIKAARRSLQRPPALPGARRGAPAPLCGAGTPPTLGAAVPELGPGRPRMGLVPRAPRAGAEPHPGTSGSPLPPPNPSPSCIQDRGRRWSLCSMPGGPGLSGPGGRWALL